MSHSPEQKSDNSLIQEALAHFGLTGASVLPIRHNENIICKVSAPSGNYCLRIHAPTEGFHTDLFLGDLAPDAAFRQEIALLLHLRSHGFPELQQPVPTPDGQLICKLSDGHLAMLLTWVEGQPLKSDDIDPRALGALAVRIHRAAEGFSGERPAYDEALISRLAAELRRAIASQQIPAVCGEICLRELCAIGARIRTLKTESAQYGLIHADLNFGNILSTPHGLVPIDFSLSGFGCLAQELGMLQSNYPDALSRAAVLDGARAAGAAISPDDAELFRALSILLFVSAQHDRFYQEEWFQERLRFWCSTVFTHLIPVDAP